MILYIFELIMPLKHQVPRKCLPYRLYKVHDIPDCAKLLKIVRYLYGAHQIDIRPEQILERNFPSYIKTIPSIEYWDRNNQVYHLHGLPEIVDMFEKSYHIDNLVERAEIWTKENPNFRIS